MSHRTRYVRMAASLACWLMGLSLLVMLAPSVALADDYSIEQVVIDATVAPDGSVSVKEARTFDFDGDFHGVYWEIPSGTYKGRDIETLVGSVGEMVDGSFVAFPEDYSGSDHTYQLSDYGSGVRIKLYSAHSDERATFVINYTDTNLAARYDDVSELYWKFVSDGWDVESKNVTCTVHLPVPAGKAVEPEENVRAWGHGPLDATVRFVGDDVVYEVPGVGTSEYAEARITFPAEWLSGASSRGGRVLQDILSEERAWADEANARRERARRLTYGGTGLLGLLTLGSIVASLMSLVRYRASHKPHFDDTYFRDVPSDDHPAVLGALYRGGSPSDEDFTATLMRLTDMGAIDLELVTVEKKGAFGKVKQTQDYRLTCPPKTADQKLDAIDRQALLTLFDEIGRYAKRHEGDSPAADIVYFSQLEKVAKKHPERFDKAYRAWEGVVAGEVARRRFFKGNGSTGHGLAIASLVVMFFAFFATVVFMIFTEAILQGVLLLLAEAASFAFSIVVLVKNKSISEEAIELTAKLKALRRWLKDFTRLEEAVPRDVVLWNRLLVMAVVLGVAEEVIEQLKMTMPEVLEDPYMASTYGWYYSSSAGRPYERFHNSYESAHSVSSAKLASSESSSGGGGGGGFSGGGGGGFGGGGGGGAF